MKAYTLFLSLTVLSVVAFVFSGFYGGLSSNYDIEQDANLTTISDAYKSLNESQSQIKAEIETATSNPIDGLLAGFKIALNVGQHLLAMVGLFPAITGSLLGSIGLGYISPFIDTLLYSALMLIIVGALIRWVL